MRKFLFGYLDSRDSAARGVRNKNLRSRPELDYSERSRDHETGAVDVDDDAPSLAARSKRRSPS
jgi:hypothetical protein